jgi:small-conductance mechanosensitive channel
VRVLDSCVIVAIMLVINSFLSFLSRKYATGLKLPVKGLIQAVKVVLWIITSILVMSVFINKQPMYLFGGLTALSAVLLLVFKDSILGLTSGFQLLVNDLVRVGDWIEVPGQRADGEIVDILITTVRVRNWDNTIVNIPAYYLIANSFVNWRGMSEAGARRIKRAMNIDLTTIRFLEKQDIEKLKEIHLIKDYLENKEKEILNRDSLLAKINISNVSDSEKIKERMLQIKKEEEERIKKLENLEHEKQVIREKREELQKERDRLMEEFEKENTEVKEEEKAQDEKNENISRLFAQNLAENINKEENENIEKVLNINKNKTSEDGEDKQDISEIKKDDIETEYSKNIKSEEKTFDPYRESL